METAVSPGAHPRTLAWSGRLPPALSWLYGFALVVLVAGNEGGFRPTTWAWTALVAWWVVVLALIVKRRTALGRLDAALLAGLAAFTGWFALSAAWSRSAPSTLDEVVRYVAYVGVVAAALLLVERRTVAHLVGGVTTAIGLLVLYALGTRVFPDRLGVFDPSETQYRLATPITYWNGLGLVCAMGLLLAAAFAVRSPRLVTRGVAAASLPVLAAAMMFSFSRGAWVALAAGYAVTLLVDPRRMQLTVATLVLGAAPTVAVVLSAEADGLTVQGSTLAQATEDGHRLAVWLAVLCLVSAAAGVAFGLAERRIAVPRALRLTWIAALVTAGAIGVAAVWATQGSPAHIAREAWDRANTGVQLGTANNAQRFFDLSSNGRFELWRVGLDAFDEHRLRGTGGGTFWELWAESPRQSFSTVEGHSVYVETLAELGVIGLALLLVAVLTPLVAAVRVRHQPLLPLVCGAYAAWLAHAGVDWDWELLGVTGAALLCGSALVVAARGDGYALRGWVRGGAALASATVAVLALTSVVANVRIDDANDELVAGRPAEAVADADLARRFAPWSVDALEALAAARTAQRREADALDAYREMVERDPDSWLAWAALAEAATGAERRRALEEARRLNPRGPQV